MSTTTLWTTWKSDARRAVAAARAGVGRLRGRVRAARALVGRDAWRQWVWHRGVFGFGLAMTLVGFVLPFHVDDWRNHAAWENLLKGVASAPVWLAGGYVWGAWMAVTIAEREAASPRPRGEPFDPPAH